MNGESNLVVHIIISTPQITSRIRTTLSTWGMENPIYQTINFVRIVTVILLNDLRMLLQHFELDFFHFSILAFFFHIYVFASLSFANTVSFMRLHFFYNFHFILLLFYSFDPKISLSCIHWNEKKSFFAFYNFMQ